MTRTDSEILGQIGGYLRQGDVYNRAAARQLVRTLPLELAMKSTLLNTEVTPEQWESKYHPTDSDIIRHLCFKGSPPGLLIKAWRDANACAAMNCRRNLASIAALIWALGPEMDELYANLIKEMNEFVYYGKRGLVMASEELGIPWGSIDDDEWKLVPDDEEPKRASEVVKM